MWSAKPRVRASLAAFGIWAFAIPWTAFSLFWEAMSLAGWLSGKPPVGVQVVFAIIFPIFGIPFVLVGVAMLAAPFYAIRAQAQALMALTNRRILLITGARRRKVRSVLLQQMGPMTRHEGADGYGSLEIQTHTRTDSDGDKVTESLKLDGVPGVAQLEQQIMDALRPR